ncbi:MAG: DUF4178 domain-containing protein [Myxococcales bacterium]|nr:DUF4178 domain-containing protein [Myxococcales bacterium]
MARLGEDIGELEILGQVAPLATVPSVISVGRIGQWRERSFTVVGQLQYDHGSGPWNEWYVSFEDGAWGWVVEAQGRVFLTFSRSLIGLPPSTEIVVGGPLLVNDMSLRVVEENNARLVAMRGEVPFRTMPDDEFHYADVEGADGRFGTINFEGGEPVAFFLGCELSIEELLSIDIDGDEPINEDHPVHASLAVGLNCPHCGAAVELRKPDESVRVTCASCGSLLDCTKGNELYLLTSQSTWIPEGRLALGTQGKLSGVRWTVYGMLAKSTRVQGMTYGWKEYLLHQKQGGWCWLVESEGHWTLFLPVSAGSIEEASDAQYILINGAKFDLFSTASARVDGLRGEFYWKVAVGDRVSALEYVKPPQILSEERSGTGVNYSLGQYLRPQEVETAFALSEPLPPPRGIAPHQPNPRVASLRAMVQLAVVATVLLLVISLGRSLLADHSSLIDTLVRFEDTGSSSAKRRQALQGQPITALQFDLPEQSNLAIRALGRLPAGAMYLDGVLSEVLTMRSRQFGVMLESDGHGIAERTVYLGEVLPGNYELRLTPSWFGAGYVVPSQFQVQVEADVFMGWHLFAALFFLWVLPGVWGLMYLGFETRRWGESEEWSNKWA